MLNQELLEQQLSELPLYIYHFFDPKTLEFTERVRWICTHECPMYGTSWACPPAVGSVHHCKAKCLGYDHALVIATITEVADIANIEETLATRPDHEAITNQVRDHFRAQGIEPYVESHGINILPLIEELGLCFQYGENVVTWFSLLLY